MSTNPHLEVFPSEYHMLKFFGKYLPKLDVDASGRLAPFLYSYDGELVYARNFYEFLEQIEAMTALGIDARASVKKQRAYLVFFHDTPKSPAKFVENVGKIAAARENVLPAEEVVEISSLVSTAIVEPTVPEVVAEVNVEVTEPRADKDELVAKAEALRDESKKAAAKAALEAFAMEHGISLSKGKTFDAMIEDFKAAL